MCWLIGWYTRSRIWAGLPPYGSVVIYKRFFCDRHVAGFDLIVQCLRLRGRSRCFESWLLVDLACCGGILVGRGIL